MRLTGTLSGGSALSGSLSGAGGLSGGLSIATVATYHGPYEFTPTDEIQVVQIGGKQATEDIIIGAIPSNYGRIEWNGAIMTIL